MIRNHWVWNLTKKWPRKYVKNVWGERTMLMCGAWQLKYDWKTIKEGFFKTINVVYVKCQYFIEKACPCVVKTDTKNKIIILYLTVSNRIIWVMKDIEWGLLINQYAGF